MCVGARLADNTDMQQAAEPTPTPRISIEASRAIVLRGDMPVGLSPREREIAVAVAIQTRPISAERLADLIYPDRDVADARNAVKVYVHRLRRRLAHDFIVRTSDGYTIGRDISVDFVRAKRLFESAPHAGTFGDTATRDDALTLARSLRSPSPFAANSDWHPNFAYRAHRLGHDLAIAVARRDLDAARYRAALAVVRELTLEDPCDEEAWEIAALAQRMLGEAKSAKAGLNYCREALKRELDVEPSNSIRRLLIEC